MSISINCHAQVRLFLTFYIMTLLAGCNFLSVKQYQCLIKDMPTQRDTFNFPVNYGLNAQDFRGLFYSINMDGRFSILKASDSKYYLKYHSCPIRRYLFENGRLIEEGRLYFDGFWHYVSVSIPESGN